jgi:glycosyltransferase involved in cell wall biosynthesis
LNTHIKDIIIVEHNYNRVISVLKNRTEVLDILNPNLLVCMKEVSTTHPDSILIWVHQRYKENINYNHVRSMAGEDFSIQSYHVATNTVAGEKLGYIDWGTFVHVDKQIRYPTWLMSSDIGLVSADTLNKLSGFKPSGYGFDFDLCVLAKINMPYGLFCYSNPDILLSTTKPDTAQRIWDISTLYIFIASTYNRKWVIMLMLNLLIYERVFHMLAFIKALFTPRIHCKTSDFTRQFPISDSDEIPTVDVIIPTIGRKKYLLDFLSDLKQQTSRISQVIIIEQNPDTESQSELISELKQENWPFAIKHVFTHKTGACNARNEALKYTKSEWIFLADDDIRINSEFIHDAFNHMSRSRELVFTLSCLKINEVEKRKVSVQWPTFGSGCSIVHKSVLTDVRFNIAYENGFGEDADFGMQLRKKGYDIIYLPQPAILHLKAAVGGFRNPIKQPWHTEPYFPKPSPTIMLYHILYYTVSQRRGYKLFLFISYFFTQKTIRVYRYYKTFRLKYSTSLKWALTLKQKMFTHV